MKILETYFCPEYAHKFSSTEDGKSLDLKVKCPNCPTEGQFTGCDFIFLGAFIWFFMAMILTREAMYFGNAFFFTSLAVGIIRFFREHKAYYKE